MLYPYYSQKYGVRGNVLTCNLLLPYFGSLKVRKSVSTAQWGFFWSVCCCLAIKSSSTLHDPMDQSTPGPPVFHCLPELGQSHVGCFDDTVQPSHPLSSSSSLALTLSQHQGLFQGSFSSHEMAKVLEPQLQDLSFQGAKGYIQLKNSRGSWDQSFSASLTSQSSSENKSVDEDSSLNASLNSLHDRQDINS